MKVKIKPGDKNNIGGHTSKMYGGGVWTNLDGGKGGEGRPDTSTGRPQMQIYLRFRVRIGVQHPPPVQGRPDRKIFCVSDADVFTHDTIRMSVDGGSFPNGRCWTRGEVQKVSFWSAVFDGWPLGKWRKYDGNPACRVGDGIPHSNTQY